MKKMLKSFVVMFVFFFGILFVNAETNLAFEWKNDFIGNEANETLVEVTDGYLMTGYDEDFVAQIVKFDKEGNEVDSITFDGKFTVVGVHEKDSKYYAVVLDDWWLVSVYVLDTELEILDSVSYNYYIYDFNDVVHFGDEYIYMTSTGFYAYGGIADEYDEEFYLMMEVSYDLEDMNLVEYVGEDWKDNVEILMDVYPAHNYLLFKDSEYELVPIATAGNDKVNVVVGKQTIYDGSGTWLAVYDKDGKLIKENKIDGTAWWYVDVVVFEELIYAVGTNYNFIDVYNLEGEYVDSIDIKGLYPDIPEEEIHISMSNITLLEGGFVASYQVCDVIDDCAVNCRNAIVKYHIPYNVITQTDGNGTVTVSSNTNYSGTDVSFTVEPKEGYVLGEVKVTDANGNVVIFNDYRFTMPSADVIIEVTFVKEVKNPNTADIMIVLVGMVAIIGVGTFIKSSKKLSWMK